MKKLLLIICFLWSVNLLYAQRVIYNPDFKGTNFAGRITKVEILDTTTVLHFIFRESIGSRFSIPSETYIEDSERGNRLYVNGSEGITRISGWNTITEEHADGFRYKLYFPPLNKEVKKINYGESNIGGNWFMYKIDLTQNGKSFIARQNFFRTSNNQVWVLDSVRAKNQGKQVPSAFTSNKEELLERYKSKNNSDINTLLPTDLPKSFFGNWHDKYGTLILATTPDYLLLDNRIQYYRGIEEIGSRYKINSSANTFEILNVDSETLVIRTTKIMVLKRGKQTQNAPSYLKGEWLHWAGVKEITISDKYFYNNDKDYHGTLRDIIKNKIDLVAESDTVVWFVLYHSGEYHLYSARKNNGEYTLQAQGFINAKYKKR